MGAVQSACRLGWVAGLAALVGCGDGLPQTYPVQGKVVYRGAKGPPGGTITFQLAADPQVVADAELGADGRFVLTTKMLGKSKPGAAAGEYNVMVEHSSLNVGPDGQVRIQPIVVPK